MNRTGALFAALLAAAANAGSPVEAIDPWIGEAPPVTGVTAGYVQVRNGSGAPIALEGAVSPRFDRIEMHESMVHEGMSSMHALERVEIPPGETVSFAPGGRHFMLFAKPPLPRAGETVPLALRFSDGSVIELEVPVRSAK